MNEIFLISLTWKDILYIKNENNNNKIFRKTNDDNGIYKIENNKLIINWSNWGEEIFETTDKKVYYKSNYNLFNIQLQTETYFEEAELNKSTEQITLLYSKKKGNYTFINNNLHIQWENNQNQNQNQNQEIFYMYDYGNLFSNIKNSSYCYNKKLIKNIAILFPQFHEIPENNEFWGKGFTEWTLLKKMPKTLENQMVKQPHPDLGYYNLTNKDHRIFIENLAKTHQIHGFCYYHYWFKNKKIMYEPLELMLKDGHPNLPFMFCWANEQWTKRWDGGNNEILIEQDYDDEEGNKNHFEYILQYFKHKNYIKINNKPIFIFYRIEEKDKKSITNIINKWNLWIQEHNFDGIHFMRFMGPFDNKVELENIEGFINFEQGNSTQNYGTEIISYNENNLIFNNIKEYNEEEYLSKNKDIERLVQQKKIESGLIHYKNISNKEKLIRTSKFNVYCGKTIMKKIKEQKIKKENNYLGFFLGWNNFPRRNYTNKKYSTYPLYYKDINNELIKTTYESVLKNTNDTSKNKLNMIFLTSWNEWNEQSSLEPNNYDGYNYLQLIKKSYENYYKFEKTKNILLISHRGGGTEKYINDLKTLFNQYNFIYYDENINKNKEINNYSNIDILHINSFYTLKLINHYHDFFKNNFNNIEKIITIHDYQWIYPDNPNILSYDFNKNEYDSTNIHNFIELIKLCKYVIFPSYNILKNYNSIVNFEDNEELKSKIVMSPHCDNFINHKNIRINAINKYIHIAYIGNFIEYKGSKLFKYLFNKLKYFNGYQIKYHIFGYLSDEEKNDKINHENFIYHQAYEEHNLLKLLEENNIHIITHFSLFEESYCYALTQSINSGIPIIYINHGALTERLDANQIPKKYFPSSYNDLLTNFNKILNYIYENQNYLHIENNNYELQNSKWYINHY